jgi:hypothetical protein
MTMKGHERTCSETWVPPGSSNRFKKKSNPIVCLYIVPNSSWANRRASDVLPTAPSPRRITLNCASHPHASSKNSTPRAPTRTCMWSSDSSDSSDSATMSSLSSARTGSAAGGSASTDTEAALELEW